ncbi:ParD-like antitoxin of type II toxin-antitoxin system [Nitrosomonas sp. Nm51]|uniref:TA system antitoxin ParD family protein n=1 Tax=Nitrosomonas sp. Nm51 TaxID=133720 RepID=UPI0008C9525A|nr:hypothetical protein [Nitrosomonas sp. Nm51]SER18044.1 ParD-like antitoxin of type II toxin-antitoxin system [Nitrosomonas sp. Nm51]
MAKSASPIRLQEELMKAAGLAASRHHRSTAEQIEFWAELGRSVADTLDPDVMLSVKSGLSRIKVEPVYGVPVDPDAVFESLENKRKNGTLSNRVTAAAHRYQASSEHPGYLDRIDREGNTTTGRFQKGQFIPLNEKTA